MLVFKICRQGVQKGIGELWSRQVIIRRIHEVWSHQVICSSMIAQIRIWGRIKDFKSEVGGENRSEAEVPYRESKPSAHAHATHDTTDQSGAISSGG